MKATLFAVVWISVGNKKMIILQPDKVRKFYLLFCKNTGKKWTILSLDIRKLSMQSVTNLCPALGVDEI